MIALALACRPSLVIADEPTTALDVVMQAQVLQLLEHLREQLGLALILISHDLGVLAETCDRIAIMYAGRIVEIGDVDSVFGAPQHPYTKRLLDTLPVIGGERGLATPIPGGPPDPGDMPEGCRFRPRCPYAAERCLQDPPLREVRTGHASACHFAPWSEWPEPAGPAAPGGGMSESLMEVRDLAVTFKVRRGVTRAVDGVSPGVAAGGDLRGRRRVGLREVDPGPRAARPARTRRGRAGPPRRADRGQGGGGRAAQAGADDLPGPLPDAQSAPAGALDRRPSR